MILEPIIEDLRQKIYRFSTKLICQIEKFHIRRLS